MDEEKLFELEVELTNIHCPIELNLENLRGRLRIADLTTTIHYREPLTFHLQDIEPQYDVALDLNVDGTSLGQVETTFEELWGDVLLGRTTKTFPLTGLDGATVEISVAITDLTESAKAQITESALEPGAQSGCPYFSKMSKAQYYEKKAQDVLERLRMEIGEFIGGAEEEGLSTGGRSPTKSGRSPSKISRSGRSPGSGSMSPYKRRTAKEIAGAGRQEELPEIEIPSRFSLEFRQLSSEEILGLKNLVIGLNEKLRLFRVQSDEIEQFQSEIQACEAAQNDLNISMKETREQVQQSQSKLQEYQSEIQYQTSQAQHKAEQHKARTQAHQQRLQELQKELEEARRENDQLKGLTEENIDEEIMVLKGKCQVSEQKRVELQQQLQERIQQFSKNQAQLIKQRETNHIEKLKLERELQTLAQQNERLELENSQLLAEYTKLKAQEQLELHLREKLSLTQAIGYQENNQGKLLRDVHDELLQASEAYVNKASLFEQSLEKENKNLNYTVTQLNASVKDKQEELGQLKDQAKSLKRNLEDLQQLHKTKQDLNAAYKRLLHQNETIRGAKDTMIQELSWLADYFILQARGALAEHRIHTRIKTVWDQKNFELEALQHSVVEEKNKHPIYISVKGDIVDEALAEYLNSRDDPLTVPFIREAPEVYLFGTKRIWLKFEKGKLSARVGGGFLPIEDFIEAYTEVEAEKFEVKHRENSPAEKKFMAKFVEGIVGPDSPKSPKRIREEIQKAVGSREFVTAYGLRGDSSRSPSPSRTQATQSPDRNRSGLRA